MIYTIKTLGGNANGQALLESVEKRGNFPAISLLMPENKARQIVKALDFVEKVSNMTLKEIDQFATSNVRESLLMLRKHADEILK